MFANRVNTDREHSLQDIVSQEGQAAGARATVIDVTGKVLADSEAAASAMENLAQTPEFAEALKGEIGTDTRPSQTVGNCFPLCGGSRFRRRGPLGVSAVGYSEPPHRICEDAAGWFGACFPGCTCARRSALAQFTARRLQRIVQFANKIAGGELDGTHR